MEKYLSRLTEAEQDEAEKIEAELNELVVGGFTEATATAFISAVPVIRRYTKGATVVSIFDVALRQGVIEVLSQLSREERQEQHKGSPRRKTRKSGARLVT